FEAGFVLHLIADWLLQNHWMAANKVKLSHPAAWVHGGIHGVLLGLYFGYVGGITLGLLHVLIDTRVPVRWWNKVFKKCANGPELLFVSIGCDQTLHIVCIAGWILLRHQA